MAEQTVTLTDDGFTITRTFSAPLTTVWDVWTKPQYFEKWFHAVPGSVQLDVRTGGTWKADMRLPDGSLMPMGGAYREVEHQRRLVWTMPSPMGEIVMHATFAPDGDRTVAVYGQNVPEGASCDDVVAGSTGILDGFEQCLSEVVAGA